MYGFSVLYTCMSMCMFVYILTAFTMPVHICRKGQYFSFILTIVVLFCMVLVYTLLSDLYMCMLKNYNIYIYSYAYNYRYTYSFMNISFIHAGQRKIYCLHRMVQIFHILHGHSQSQQSTPLTCTQYLCIE